LAEAPLVVVGMPDPASQELDLLRQALAEARADLAEARRAATRWEQAALADRQHAGRLLGQLAHRARNDLATLIALVALEADSVAEPASGEALPSTTDRLRALAQVYAHVRLAAGAEPVVDGQALVEGLCEELQDTAGGTRPIRVLAEAAVLPLSQAGSLALILTELVARALGPALADDRASPVRVELARVGAALALTVEGSTSLTAPGRGAALGEEVVRRLARRLQGRFAVEAGEAGTCCRLSFPAPAVEAGP
jgi:two-component sensor histidine kinase